MWQSNWFPTETAHINTFWLDTSKTRISKWSKSSRPASQKESLLKTESKPKNYELLISLVNNFHLCKTKQSKFTGKKCNPYTQTRTVLDICLLCTWTQRLWICSGWKVYWKNSPCTYTYIHISRAVKLLDVADTHFSCGCNFSLVSNSRSQCSHL